ncbi:MAG: flavin reductase family protein [Algibacter sp.]
MATKTIDPKTIKTSELHQILLSAVAPRPIALASTIDVNGNVNLSPFSFFNVFSANPPILIFSPARRGRDNTVKHTYENVKAVNEVVVNIVNHNIVEQTSLSSTEYDSDVNEFEKAGFTAIPSDTIKPPRVAESPVSFECKVQDVIELGHEGGAGNLVISRIECIHIQEKYLNASGSLDTQKLDLVARMGESWYCRASGEALFEIPKPIYNKGIGIDNLPKHVVDSNILSGNNLGRLGNLEQTPNALQIEKHKKRADIQSIFQIEDENERKDQLHKYAQVFIKNNQPEIALEVLFCMN